MLTSTAGPIRIRRVGPATSPNPGVALGFSNRAVVEAAADEVRALIGVDPTSVITWKHGAPDELFYRVRDTDAYTLKVSAGTVEVQVKYARPHDDDGARWRDHLFGRDPGCQLALWEDDEDDEDDTLKRGVIRSWSPRSRARMVKALAQIDHDGWKNPDWRLSMVTLTLPGDWLAVAPRGADFKKMLERFRARWVRAGLAWQVVWKLEFQRRGAPHAHLMMRIPPKSFRISGLTFQEWLSVTWARCVGADSELCICGGVSSCDCRARSTEYTRHVAAGTNVDLGITGTDPKRIAVYFLKHSAKTMDNKEYQHHVPPQWWGEGDGPGRFWGISGLERPVETVEVPEWAWNQAKRILRGVHRGNRARIALARRNHAVGGFGERIRRSTLEDLRVFGGGKDHVLRSALGGGWVLSGDAPLLLYRIAQFIAARSRCAMLE